MVIAIDGPSGVGKSTVSRALAAALGLAYLDTGSYYRAVTHVALEAGVEPEDEPGILQAISAADFSVVDGALTLGGADISTALRGPDVTAAVSTVAAHPAVREAVVEMQRAWAQQRGDAAVVEGRDIGTVVFPDAPVKVFLTADTLTRARRRAGDPESDGTSIEQLVADIERRDAADSSRPTSPLRPACDAIVIDTSDLSVDQVVDRIRRLVEAV